MPKSANETSMTDDASGLPRWRRIADALATAIHAGDLAPGARLPGETTLAATHGVNRHTVRHAIEDLVRRGLVRVEQGRGSFVAEDVLDYAVSARTRFSETIRRHNREPSGRRLDLSQVPADPTVAAALELAPGDPVIRLRRLGLADGRPITLGTHWFPAARLPGLAAALDAAPTISAAFAQVGVSDYRRQTTRVTARLPTIEEANLLQTQRHRPLLVTESLNVDASGAIVEFGTACYPTPRVQIVIDT